MADPSENEAAHTTEKLLALVNAGDAAGCVKLYRQTAMGIVRDVDVDSG